MGDFSIFGNLNVLKRQKMTKTNLTERVHASEVYMQCMLHKYGRGFGW